VAAIVVRERTARVGLARSPALLAVQGGDLSSAQEWIDDARTRCNRIQDRYVWVSAYVDLARLQIVSHHKSSTVESLASKLYSDAIRFDLPEFAQWAVIYHARLGSAAPSRDAAACPPHDTNRRVL